MRAATGRRRDVREADLSELLPKKTAINRGVQGRDRSQSYASNLARRAAYMGGAALVVAGLPDRELTFPSSVCLWQRMNTVFSNAVPPRGTVRPQGCLPMARTRA